MFSSSLSRSLTLALLVGGAASCIISDGDDGEGGGGAGATATGTGGTGGMGGSAAGGGGTGGQGGAPTGTGGTQPFTTHDCTNPDPLTCPGNDCFEQAVGSDNDTPANATPLGPDGPLEAILCGGANDFDYYTLAAPPGCGLGVTATFTYGTADGEGDISLYLERDGTSFLQDTNSDLDGAVSIQAVSRSATPYHVYLVDTAQSTPVYMLEHTLDCAPLGCPDNDRNEPNDTPNEASGGTAPATMLGDTFGAIACPGEEDWYYHPASTAGASCTPKAVLRFDPAFDGMITGDLRISDVTDIEETIEATAPGELVVSALSNVSGSALLAVTSSAAEAPVYTVEILCD